MSSGRPDGHLMPQAGLCTDCVHAEVLGNRRGSLFLFCALSRRDSRFPRYPALPVLRCDGYRGRQSATTERGAP